ncbi:MAG TPA: ribosome maturation factor RimM [Acidimicrobiia bacterium]|nr:ribosome maturation factor RimM [Acidimicrobiia bacterium]
MKKKGSALESSFSTERFKVGRLGRPHGLQGYLGLYVEDEDLVHFQSGSVVYVLNRPYTVRAVRRAKLGHQVAFSEITTRDTAEEIRGKDVFVSARRSLAENEYWPDDLIGLEVRPGGGVVAGVNHGPTQDRLVVARSGTTFEVPFVDELVPVVDVESGYVEIAEIEGLSEPSDPG